MPLSLVPSGANVFLDANIFVYAFLNGSRECQGILKRCAQEDVFGVTSLHTVNEATHRLMLAEAVSIGIIPKQNARLLNKHPHKVKSLSIYWTQTKSILEMNLLVLDPNEKWLRSAQDVRTSYGLLTNDSLIVAAMQSCGLSALISSDAGFDTVANLTRYAPTDLP